MNANLKNTETSNTTVCDYEVDSFYSLSYVLNTLGSLSERAGVRARLAADPEWLGRYISHIVTMLQCQDNALLTLFPGGQISPPPNNGEQSR